MTSGGNKDHAAFPKQHLIFLGDKLSSSATQENVNPASLPSATFIKKAEHFPFAPNHGIVLLRIG